MDRESCPPGFILTDASTGQCVKKISDTHFIVLESGGRFDIDIKDFTKRELEDYVLSYYDDLEDVYRQYGNDANQIIAEIIAETRAPPKWPGREILWFDPEDPTTRLDVDDLGRYHLSWDYYSDMPMVHGDKIVYDFPERIPPDIKKEAERVIWEHERGGK